MNDKPSQAPLLAAFAASLGLTILAGLAFVNNAVVIFRWWAAFLSAGGDPSKIPASCPGCFPWLDWSAVDYSAVTTFIPFLGLACVTRGLLRILRGRSADPEFFPFSSFSDQFNVALGLFGTLWGIIVIGYFKMDSVSMADLMMCLHTALFSTLAAVVWVFMLDHPLIRPLMRHLLERRGLSAAGDSTLPALLADLTSAWKASGEALAAFRQELDKSGATLASFSQSCETTSRALDTRLQALEKREAAADGLLAKLADTVGSLQSAQRALTDDLAAARAENERRRAELETASRRAARAEGVLGQVRTAVGAPPEEKP